VNGFIGNQVKGASSASQAHKEVLCVHFFDNTPIEDTHQRKKIVSE